MTVRDLQDEQESAIGGRAGETAGSSNSQHKGLRAGVSRGHARTRRKVSGAGVE